MNIKKLNALFALLFLTSCGTKTAQSGQTVTVNFDLPGPAECLSQTALTHSQKRYNQPVYANFSQSITKPISIENLKTFLPKFSYDNFTKNLKIINGTTCSTTSDPKILAACKSTVVISIKDPSINGELCTGVLVSPDLILTAAHCFNGLSANTYNDPHLSTSKVIFGDNLNSSDIRTIQCWQRNSHYHSNPATDSDESTALYDIGWIKLNTPAPDGYDPAKILKSTESIEPKETKLSIGYGATASISQSSSPKSYITTDLDPTYALRGDVVPGSGVYSSTQTSGDYFNSLAKSILAAQISDFPENPLKDMITVIGPINGGSSRTLIYDENSGNYTPNPATKFPGNNKSYGTCFGDSGGPTFISRNGEYVVAALTQGSITSLSPHPVVDYTGKTTNLDAITNFDYASNPLPPAVCEDGYGTYTRASYYIDWIETTSHESITPSN